MYDRFENDDKFWATLEWMPGGQELWSFIAPYNPFILTSPMEEGSRIGKREWIAEKLKPPPKEIHMSHEKYRWATTDDRPNILIDDWDKNLIPWSKAQGYSEESLSPYAIRCAFGDSASAIAELKELGFGAE